MADEVQNEGQAEVLQSDEGELSALKEQLATAVAKYRALALASSPDIPEELVQGDTVEEVEASLLQARQIVERVKHQLEVQRTKERVPAGTPLRTGVNLSALPPREKIAYALGKQQR